MDIMPTLLRLVGAEPPADLDGIDLAPLIAHPDETFGRKLVLSGSWGVTSQSVPIAVRTLNTKLYAEWRAGAFEDFERFDLRRDPAEEHPLSVEPKRELRSVFETLAQRIAAAPTDVTTSTRLNDEVREKLRALGYLE